MIMMFKGIFSLHLSYWKD